MAQKRTKAVSPAKKATPANAALRESEVMLARAQEVANLGSFVWTIQTGELRWSAHLYRIFGLDPDHFRPNYDTFLKLVVPEDRDYVRSSVERALKGEPYSVEYRMKRSDGSVRDILSQAKVDFDRDNRPVRLVGTALDITERKRIERELFDSNQRLKALMNALPVGVSFSEDSTCQKITGNPTVLAQFEVSRTDNLSASAPDEQAPGRHVSFFQDGRQITDAELPLQRAVSENREIRGVELEVVLPSGRRWFSECHGAPVHDENEKVVGGIAVTVDVTARKQAEEASHRYELLAEKSRDIILFIDRETRRIIEANAAAVAAYGYSRDELQRMEIAELRSRKTSDLTPKQLEEADQRGILFETEHRRKNGTVFPVEVSSQGATIAGKRYLISIIRDITSRKQTELALKESEQQLRFHVENTPLAVIEWGPDFRLRRWSGEAERIFGWTADEVIGKRISDFRWVYEEDAELVARTSKGLVTGAEPRSVSSNRNYRKDGSVVHCEWYNSSRVDESGRLVSILSLVLDITERKRLEEELRRRAEEIETLMDVAPVAILVAHDPECRMITGNRMANRFYEAREGENLSNGTTHGKATIKRRFFRGEQELLPPELPMQQAAMQGSEVESEFEVLLPSGKRLTIYGCASPLRDASGRVRGCVGAFVDITARKQAEQALIRTEKLASVGRMAATIAHEINNPLAAVMNSIYLARTRATDVALEQHLRIAEGELNRVAHITRQALGFYRESATPIQTDAAEIIGSVLDLLRSKIASKRVQIHLDRKGDSSLCVAPGELRQVLSNIVANSLDAIPVGGTVRIRTSRSSAVSAVRITISDDGSGIEEASLPHVFEPFFTTKDAFGTGLGLWISKQLVEKHKGTIRVRSKTAGPCKGTTFCVTIPRQPA